VVPFLDYNKTKKEKSGTLWGETLWGKCFAMPGELYLYFSVVEKVCSRSTGVKKGVNGKLELGSC